MVTEKFLGPTVRIRICRGDILPCAIAAVCRKLRREKTDVETAALGRRGGFAAHNYWRMTTRRPRRQLSPTPTLTVSSSGDRKLKRPSVVSGTRRAAATSETSGE